MYTIAFAVLLGIAALVDVASIILLISIFRNGRQKMEEILMRLAIAAILLGQSIIVFLTYWLILRDEDDKQQRLSNSYYYNCCFALERK